MTKDDKILHELHQIREILRHQHNQHQLLMSVLSDLQTAVANLQTASANENSAVLAAIADINSLPTSDAALVPLTSAINAVAASTQANADALNKAVGAATGPAPTTPVIVNQPQPPNIPSGGTETMTVSATGGGLTFQWFQGSASDTSNPISGATSASFTTPALTATTSYWVRVTNAAGSVDSSTVVVTVTP